MDKAMYKQLVADLMRKESELKSILKTIMETVKEYPNDMELGGVIRSMFWDKRDISNDKQLDLFESIDDNKNRAKIIKLYDKDS
tara:strand:+ start:179 stop:430 length:252 start_codon:yes stop_codon:yes gene_type:complete